MTDVEITTPAALWDWLEAHHTRPDSVRLITWKAAHPDKYVSREDVLDALIAYGWIDGRRFVVDDDRTAQLIAPRQQQAWSQSYKDRAERLRAKGRMRPAGEDAIAQGKASGLWYFFADVDALIVPDDLAADLDLARWEALAPSYRRNVLRWIKLAKTAPTRAKRIRAAARATQRGEKLPQM
ncbi:YdeI/OmpD-associated family protein [Sulfitobacter albidus]|uniref:YdeI/OmpD-associated family protein n=1 Tax=Sulfitobacter albidus TaxID=2829501 RepID=A0A975JBM8_9RHOB|nr:YdeI/OmpD-associated family protein [Sulfitobacter albidus]QUJ75509.1 YdeI/OmpD-associated family protein [Sulfitobacter albidus]